MPFIGRFRNRIKHLKIQLQSTTVQPIYYILLQFVDNLEETVHIDKKRDGVTADEKRSVC